MRNLAMWAAGVTALLAAGSAGAVQYNVINLGTVGGVPFGGTVQARGINNLGQVVGWQQLGAFIEGFVWTAETGMVGIGRNVLYDINDVGVAVGQSAPLFPDNPFAVRVLLGGTVEAIGGITSRALRINASGAIVGSSQDPWPPYGFIWREGEAPQIAALPPQSAFLNAINDAGVAVGGFNTSAASWTQASGWTVLPAVWGSSAEATGINNGGTVVGTAFAGPFTSQGIVWNSDGTTVLIGGLGPNLRSALTAVNDSGIAVGIVDTSIGGGITSAFRWSAASGIEDLNSLIDPGLGWQLMSAFDINAKGQIVGMGQLAGVGFRAFLLDPISVSPPPPGGVVPEPATWAMLIAGFGLVGGSLRRQRKVAA